MKFELVNFVICDFLFSFDLYFVRYVFQAACEKDCMTRDSGDINIIYNTLCDAGVQLLIKIQQSTAQEICRCLKVSFMLENEILFSEGEVLFQKQKQQNKT